jgi:hypothetical protein
MMRNGQDKVEPHAVGERPLQRHSGGEVGGGRKSMKFDFIF